MAPPEVPLPDLARLFKWFGVVLLVCGLGFATMGVLELRNSVAAVRNGLEAEGRVVSLVRGIGSSLYRPRVEFRTPDGKAHTLLGPDFKKNRWYQLQWEAVEGELVIVLYDPDDLGRARIKHFWLLWGWPAWMLLAGLGIVVFGLFALVVRPIRKVEPAVV